MAQIKVLKIDSIGLPREHDAAADDVTFLTGQFGNLNLAGNSLTSTDTAGDINITPDTTGDLVLDGINWPQADGSANQILKTDGLGQLSFVDAFAENVDLSYTADEALLIRDAVYISAADNVSKADASAESTARLIGFATAAAADTNPVVVRKNGTLDGFTGLTVGARQWLSETAGEITETAPTTAASALVQAGFAKNSTTLDIQIQFIGRRL